MQEENQYPQNNSWGPQFDGNPWGPQFDNWGIPKKCCNCMKHYKCGFYDNQWCTKTPSPFMATQQAMADRLNKLISKEKQVKKDKANEIVHMMNLAMYGDGKGVNNLDLKDCSFLKKELNTFLNNIKYQEDRLRLHKLNGNLPKGTDIPEFWFIEYTKTGIPKIAHRKIGDKGITHIEVYHCGKEFENSGRIKQVRVTGLKEDGKTEYHMYFGPVYTNLGSWGLEAEYKVACFKWRKYGTKKVLAMQEYIKSAEEIIKKEKEKLCNAQLVEND